MPKTSPTKTQLPYPSMLIDAPQLVVESGSEVIVTLISGSKIKGQLLEFSPDLPTVSLLDGKGEKLIMQLELIKILTFPTQRFHAGQQPPDKSGRGVEMPPQEQPFKIDFKDGSELEGETLGYRPDEHGLHLFPVIDNNHYIQTFYSHKAIDHYRVGEFLGELLINHGLVTQMEIESAVDAQQRARKQQLGEYLLSHAIVSSEDLQKALNRQHSMPNMRLGDILVSEGLVSDQQLEQALNAQKSDRSRPLGEILVGQGIVDKVEVQRCLTKKLGIPFINLGEYQVAPEAVAKVGEEVARQFGVMPISIFEGRLVVAMENPMDREAMEALRFHSSMIVEPVMADIEGIKQAIDFYYSDSGGEFSVLGLDNPEALEEYEDDVVDTFTQDQISDNLVVKVANKIIVDAYQQGASDIHIEPYPGKNKTVVRFRKDGTLVEYVRLPSQYKNALVSRIKVMAKLDISERRKPQDGKIDFKRFGPLNIELRVATLPTTAGLEDVVMRILAAGKPLALDQLALSPKNLERLKRIIEMPYGIIFVCGPTGSGKTTTLHSILGHINTPERKIWTAEDPVEITQPGLRQVQINPKGGVTFVTAMRAFLRADPDVVMVGEMRDKETTSIGIEASLTGHLVFSTLHTNSAPESIIRLLDMGMDPFNFSDALLGVLAQRLAKRLCSHCKTAYHPEQQELDELLREYCRDIVATNGEDVQQWVFEEWRERFSNNGVFTLYRPVGCEKCHGTGYAGRIGLHEMLLGSDDIKRAIISKMPIVDLNRLAISEGMRTLLQDGIEKILQGYTDLRKVRAVCIK